MNRFFRFAKQLLLILTFCFSGYIIFFTLNTGLVYFLLSINKYSAAMINSIFMPISILIEILIIIFSNYFAIKSLLRINPSKIGSISILTGYFIGLLSIISVIIFVSHL